MKNLNKKIGIKSLIFILALPLLILVFNCSGQLQIDRPELQQPDEVVREVPVTVPPPECAENQELYYDEVTKEYSCRDREPAELDVPECTENQELVFNPETKEFTCIEKMIEEKLLECTDENYVDGKCSDKKAYPFMVMGSLIPQEGIDKGCTYWILCRLNTTVGSDFNGDGIDDIEITSPTSKTFNLLTHLNSSSTKQEVELWMDIVYRRILEKEFPEYLNNNYDNFIGGQVNLMLMKKQPGAPYSTQAMSQIQINSPSEHGNPTHTLGFSTKMQDIDNDELADLIFTSNHVMDKPNFDSVYIMFGSDKVSPDNIINKWKGVTPQDVLGNDHDNNNKMDMIEISFPMSSINVLGVTTFDYEGDGRQDLAISAYDRTPGIDASKLYIFRNVTLMTNIALLNTTGDSSFPVTNADFTVIIENGTKGGIRIGSKMVAVDFDRDSRDELAAELTWNSADNVRIGGIAVFDTEGSSLQDAEKFKMTFEKNQNSAETENFSLRNLIMHTWGVDTDLKGQFSRHLIALTSGNIDRAPGDNIKNDDLIFTLNSPYNTCVYVAHNENPVCNTWVSETGKKQVVWIAKSNPNYPPSIKDTKLFVGIWGSAPNETTASEGDDLSFDSRCNLGGTKPSKQLDPSAIGTSLAVIPGGERPDNLLISDPSYDLEGFCDADYRMPRVYLFSGKADGNFADEYHATRNGVNGIALIDGSSPQPYIQIPQVDWFGIRKLWGWYLGLIGNTQSELDPFNEFDLFIGAPQLIKNPKESTALPTYPSKVLIPDGLNKMDKTLPDIKQTARDYSGTVDFWADALQTDYNNYPNFTIKPSEEDFVDLSAAGKIIDASPGDPWEEIFMDLMSDKKCVGPLNCDQYGPAICDTIPGCTVESKLSKETSMRLEEISRSKLGQFGWTMSN